MNHISANIYKNGHQTAAIYPKEISEFDAVGLTKEFKDRFLAPYVKENNVQLDIQFKERIDSTFNGNILIIEEIQHLYFPKNCLCDDAFLDREKANTISYFGLDSYHKTRCLERLSYVKVHKEVEIVKIKYSE